MVFFIIVPATFMSFFFFFNDTATTEIYTLSLHDALPISRRHHAETKPLNPEHSRICSGTLQQPVFGVQDRKSTRLNSSHQIISYAVFCLKKKKTTNDLQSLLCRMISSKSLRFEQMIERQI